MIDYKEIKKQKESAKYDFTYHSSACNDVKAELGTIEKDACAKFGSFDKEGFRGKRIFDLLIEKEINTVLDVGAGALEATSEFIKHGKVVDICDFTNGFYHDTKSQVKFRKAHYGDFNTIEISDKYDAVWAAHILEHQLNPNIFITKIISLVKDGGYLGIVVPPRKPFIVGGHVSIWNAGLLLYHLVLAGLDCSKAQVLQYDYNIGVVVQKKMISDMPKINYDIGDINLLAKYFPIDVFEGFNGDILKVNI